MSLSLKITSKKASALMATLMIMMGLAALISFSSEQSVRFLESQRTSSLDTHITQFEETLLQSLQTAYYEQYHQIAINVTGSKIMTNVELDTIIQIAYSRLGVTGNAGTPVTIPTSSGSEITTTIQCNFPSSAVNIDTQSSNPYSAIQGTYTWLDGIFAVQKSIEITLTLQGKNSFSGKIRSTTHRYLLNLLEIPVENISMSSMGNVTLPNAAINAGSGYFAGSIQGGNGVSFQNRLISGNRTGSAVTTPESSQNRPEGWTEKGYSEIVSTNTLRDLTSQRSPALGTSLKTSYFFREGLAAQSGLSSTEQSQLKSFQPYYKTPTGQRIYGIHNPSASDDATALTLLPGSGDEQNASTLPPWTTVHLETNGTHKVQLLVDLSQITPDSNNEINVFVGTRNNSTTGPFTQAEVIILPWDNIPSDRKISVTSPNSILITGNFNQGTSPASVHFFGNKIYYGSTTSTQVKFEGTYSNYQQSSGSSSINFQASDGSIPIAANIIMTPNGSGIIHSNHHYYYLVTKSKIP